jgi:hypothetical protein
MWIDLIFAIMALLPLLVTKPALTRNLPPIQK